MYASPTTDRLRQRAARCRELAASVSDQDGQALRYYAERLVQRANEQEATAAPEAARKVSVG